MNWVIYVLIAAGALLLLAVVIVFNRMVRLRNKVKRAWRDIDIQLKLRHDLIPRLVSIAEGYALHEKDVLESVTRRRGEAQAASGAGEKGIREMSLSEALQRMLVLREHYPELKADEGFERLSRELVSVEDNIAAARKYYNGSVRIYDTYIQSFPQLLLAGLLRFRPAEYFQVEEDEREMRGGLSL
jgi:LemA protein